MSYEIEGILIQKKDTVKTSELFRKREFVLEIRELVENKEFFNYPTFEATQDRCEVLNGVEIGSTLKVQFNIKGRKWEKDGNTRYFNTLQAWNIAIVYAASNPAENNAPEQEQKDLPF